MARTSLRETALGPLSRGDAERLLPTLASRRRLSGEKRLLRGRCLRILESFHNAWNELAAFREKQRDALLRARAEIDLLYLAYYLVRREAVAGFAETAEKVTSGRPLLLAELRLAQSINFTAEDRIADAFREARFAQDAVRVAPAVRPRDLVSAAVSRQLAHLLAYSTSYEDALRAAEEAGRAAERSGDRYEADWSAYARGFVHWLAGRLETARADLDRAEQALRASGSSLWRWTSFCLATVEAELGAPQRAQRFAQQSGYGSADGLAYLALRRGDPAVAEEMLDVVQTPLDAPTRAVLGLIRCERGDERMGVRLLDESRIAFETHSLAHYALGCQIHASYWRDRANPGSGAPHGLRALESIAAGGGEGFHWYDARVARWLAAAAGRRPSTRAVAGRLAARADRVLAQTRPEAAPLEASVDEAVPYLRARGLTAREMSVLRGIEEMAARGDHDRKALAKRLRMSPNTLRVHLTRIRSKLDVGIRRGDAALLQAALRRG